MATKAHRNKTIELSVKETKSYLSHALKLKDIKEDISQKLFSDKTISGDSFKIMPKLPESFADLCIIDPPYNLTKNYNGNVFNRMKSSDYIEYTRSWLIEVKRLLKEDASIYVCCDWQSSILVAPLLSDFFIIRNRITWQREKGRGAASNWKNIMEDIWFCTNGKDYTFNLEAVKQRRKVLAPYTSNGLPKDWKKTEGGNFRDTCPSNFWNDITVPFWSMPENTDHPAQKPEKLLAKLILASSNPGDMVFDPFMGSGSTLVTAKKLGRHYLGIELEEKYVALCEYRLSMAEKNNAIQGYEDGVFWERNSQK